MNSMKRRWPTAVPATVRGGGRPDDRVAQAAPWYSVAGAGRAAAGRRIMMAEADASEQADASE
ncbi:hypothetical protein ACFT7S_17515 [Streptomyces sp. NPDC057136]|uniref:hypothetical protein n=1 Tax=Streptomyces sp. NPDC057136 TaxID=3346029 RepID=UPI00363DE0D1